jgi:hypothetical protein
MAKVKFVLPYSLNVAGKSPITTYDEHEANRLIPGVKHKRISLRAPILLNYSLDPMINGEIETDRADLIEILRAIPGLRCVEAEVEAFKASPEAARPLPPPVVALPDFDTMGKDGMIAWGIEQTPPIALDRRHTVDVVRKELRHELKKREKAEAGK